MGLNSTSEQLAVDTLRALALDMIDKAESGHQGLVLGAAPMLHVLWTRHMKQLPSQPDWPDRDRFVLSAGHGSALLYALLHVAGYDLSMQDLKGFRQANPKTPGHPEYGQTPGVEASTGPLGQGFANAVGMAMAEAHLAGQYNQKGQQVVNHHTYCLVSDGDLMEGISHEAASLAGHLKLGKLIVLYDSNDVSLDGQLDLSCSDHVASRFQAYNWQYIRVEDGEDLAEIDQAINEAKADTEHPSLIEVKTVIGAGSSLAGSHQVHGNPLKADDIVDYKLDKGLSSQTFYVDRQVYDLYRSSILTSQLASYEKWQADLVNYQASYPHQAQAYRQALGGWLPKNWTSQLTPYRVDETGLSGRDASGEVLTCLQDILPNLWGGSADLASSNKTTLTNKGDFAPDYYQGCNINYGIREHAMGAILNGICLHGGSKSYVATFLAFADYLRPAMRMAALSKLPAIYVFTHDSIQVGADGPTHQPIEQLASLRAIPNLNVFRPADANEVQAAWKIALMARDRPQVLALSRQKLAILAGTDRLADQGVARGAYVLSPAQGHRDGILIASGSEVDLTLQAQEQLRALGIELAVVSMPCQELFNEQDQAYQESVLPSCEKRRIAIELGASQSWYRYVGLEGVVLGLDAFGQSMAGDRLQASMGITVDAIVRAYYQHFYPSSQIALQADRYQAIASWAGPS
ncbi:transketolase [Aerococcus urinaehominis]|uniref:transketolase n=1 Tax=Aerococcus urinaehominis TaxID=128944 RepID=UPI000882BCBD|nr:transketolase [Aerococcus urinaehominis]SDL97174.1 transketolase [Aerococcus urinaehominis]